MGKILLKWLGHSCFRISSEGYSIIIDPFEPGTVPGLRPIEENADEVLCSHEHFDHGFRDAVHLEKGKASPFTVKVIDTFHDDSKGALRGNNKIHIIEADGVRVAHMGDIGCGLTENQLAELKDVDAIMIPIGGNYTIGPKEAAEMAASINAGVTIPMHYRTDDFGFDDIGRIDEFLEVCGRWVRLDSDEIEIGKTTRHYTAVLTYK